MQKLICKPGQRATVVRTLPHMKGHQQELMGKIVQVKRIVGPKENLNLNPAFPAWELMVPVLSGGKTYVAVYDYCLAPLPDEGDVFEFDHEEELVDQQNKEFADAS